MSMSRLPVLLLFLSLYYLAAAQDQNSFNDAYSRKVWSLAYWSTSQTPDVCVPKNNPGWKLLTVVALPGAPIYGQALAVITVSEAEKLVHVHFRGVESISTFVFNGYQYLLQADYPSQPFEGMQVAQEHTTTFSALWNGGLRKGINSAWDEYCDFPIRISGQSIGGCLAQMLVVKVKKLEMWDYSNIMLYSYSSPRCGHQPFAFAVDSSAQTRYQIRLPDYIISLPTTTCTGNNPASPQDCYWHAGYAVQYSKNIFGTISGPTRCATGEMAACLTGNIFNIGNHNGFYSQTYFFAMPTC